MINVLFPPPQFKLRTKEGKQYIFDNIRKAWLLLTEEEWVRQNMVAYFVSTLRYPQPSIAVEKKILVNGLTRRFDVLVYDRQLQPWMMVECKAPQVPLSEDVLQQLLRYNMAVPVTWMVITNGNQTIGWKKEAGSLALVSALPDWS